MIAPESVTDEINKKAAKGLKILEEAIDRGLLASYNGVSAHFYLSGSLDYIDIRDHHLEEVSRRYKMNGWHKFTLHRVRDTEFEVVADTIKPNDDIRDAMSYEDR